ncbi:2-dehydro-3-deoxygalactonokinase [Pseudovibrio sp. Tun.PSC04-5.I4]|uniref:2-dehydro-3-deoxygalactonokinase n=1 Tax=Pseudovibrio sp. Tun.PSC04-5.I4 TaxID=1798213 RepID=UPI0008915890|nr:2-dehydro-3-deoxygalactonokinase [Pseudovibrio sp. Tun.PSC04-5.I4]SDR48045.1 2-keto-3-deoxygalactonate kinase [Pseudovibrio sp. Tun.PSC04-5.I4]
MTKTPAGTKHRIVIDWGTTNFRAYLIDNKGVTVDEVEAGSGIQHLSEGEYEPELLRLVGKWLKEHGALKIYALGMITSRNGWVEVPYVACPASLKDLSKGTIRKILSDGSEIIFLPGITNTGSFPYPDVMRGEETQIIGQVIQMKPDDESTIVLPGTHSKWAKVENGTIVQFQTFVTGELFALLTTHSFIAKVAKPSTQINVDAFELGARTATANKPQSNALPTLLFSARTGMLANQLSPADLQDYLSGALIGHEFQMALASGWVQPGGQVTILGNDGLNDRYARVAKLIGLKIAEMADDTALAGATAIAQELETLDQVA